MGEMTNVGFLLTDVCRAVREFWGICEIAECKSLADSIREVLVTNAYAEVYHLQETDVYWRLPLFGLMTVGSF